MSSKRELEDRIDAIERGMSILINAIYTEDPSQRIRNVLRKHYIKEKVPDYRSVHGFTEKYRFDIPKVLDELIQDIERKEML